MMNIKWTNQKNTNATTVVAWTTKENAPKFLNQNDKSVTLDTATNQLYVYFADVKKIDNVELLTIIKKVVSDYKHLTLSFAVESFAFHNFTIEQVGAMMVEAIVYINHKSVNYKTEKKASMDHEYYLQSNMDLTHIISEASVITEAINWARDLQDTPPNIMTPTYFAQVVEQYFTNHKAKVNIKILDKKQIEELKMGLLLAVNKASDEEPRVVVLEYLNGSNNNSKPALIGKGITFDTGGYSLKPWQGMRGMKFDMSGAAIVCATIRALCELDIKTNVFGVCMLTENMIGGHGTVPESLAYAMDGQSVELTDMDAEGRLVLGDGICYAVNQLQATSIIDLSTLTGAAEHALGKWYTCAIATDQALYSAFEQVSALQGEPIWRMPLNDAHREIMSDSKIADLLNFPKELTAGMSTAAAFLDAFTKQKPFLHLDIAGTAEADERGRGVMVKSLVHFLKK